jgi:hypothetical protein
MGSFDQHFPQAESSQHGHARERQDEPCPALPGQQMRDARHRPRGGDGHGDTTA